MGTSQQSLRNNFLRVLTEADFALLDADLVQLDLPRRMPLVVENRPIEHVYFPESGVASITAATPDREIIEVGLFGFEGMSDFVIDPGQDQVSLRTFMQLPGVGWRMEAEVFARAILQSATLMSAVLRYSQYRTTQFAFTALSHGSYSIRERLARWVLMFQDRVGGEISVSHDYIAMMLAVRRSGVTEAIQLLEGAAAIKSTRGLIQVTDRNRLLELAAGSYGAPEGEYDRLFAPLARPHKI